MELISSFHFFFFVFQAFSSQLDHDDHSDNETSSIQHLSEYHTESISHNHVNSVWYGLLALGGIIGFLFFERLTIIFNDLFNQPDQTIDETTAAKCSTTNAEFLSPDLQKLNNHHHQHEMKELHETIDVLRKKTDNNLQVHDECHRSTISYPKPNGDGYIHIASHHHHHHRAHRGPSAALMVLMGDIVHNLFDGLAIGVAFAGSGISGGKQQIIKTF